MHQYQNLPNKNLSGFVSYQFYFTFSLVTRAEKLYLGQHTTYRISKTFELFLWSRWKRGRVAVKIACDPSFVYVVNSALCWMAETIFDLLLQDQQPVMVRI